MNKFNKLYNLLLLSIISLGKAERARLLANLDNHIKILNFLTDLAKKGKVESKAADFLAYFFSIEQLKDTNDKRVEQVVDVLNRNTNFNTGKFIKLKKSIEQFFKLNDKYIVRDLKLNKIDIIKYIDTNYSNLFTEKKTYDNGVVIYRVDESREAQLAVRRIIDINLGDNWNPWCLASRERGGLEANYEHFWKGRYISYPKHIAFQNGQLIAFCANDKSVNKWWNLKDEDTTNLQLLDGSRMLVEQYKWSEQELIDVYSKKLDLVYNLKTKRFDTKESIELEREDIFDGHFPVPFGVINGDFKCHFVKLLTSLENGPIEVKGEFNVSECHWLTSLIGSPKKVGSFKCHSCSSIKSLDGISLIILNDIDISSCNIIRLKNLPTEVNGDFNCSGNFKLKSLKGCPIKVTGDFNCGYTEITSFLGGPKEVGGKVVCYSCEKLLSFKGIPLNIIEIDCTFCKSLVNLEGISQNLNDLDCSYCDNLQSLQGLNKVRGLIACSHCKQLKITDLERKKYKISDISFLFIKKKKKKKRKKK